MTLKMKRDGFKATLLVMWAFAWFSELSFPKDEASIGYSPDRPSLSAQGNVSRAQLWFSYFWTMRCQLDSYET